MTLWHRKNWKILIYDVGDRLSEFSGFKTWFFKFKQNDRVKNRIKMFTVQGPRSDSHKADYQRSTNKYVFSSSESQHFQINDCSFLKFVDARLPGPNISIFWIQLNPFRSSVVTYTEKQFWLIWQWVLTFGRLDSWEMTLILFLRNLFQN